MSKIHISQYGEKGWQFSINYNGMSGVFRTNGMGEGLWRIYNGKETQIRGTCQFSLPGDKKLAYNKIYYAYFIKNRDQLIPL